MCYNRVSVKFNRCWIHYSVECVDCGTFVREMDGTPFTVSTFPLHDKTGKKVLTLWHVAGWISRTWLHPRLNFWGLFATHDWKYQPRVIAWFHTTVAPNRVRFCFSATRIFRTKEQRIRTWTTEPTWLQISDESSSTPLPLAWRVPPPPPHHQPIKVFHRCWWICLWHRKNKLFVPWIVDKMNSRWGCPTRGGIDRYGTTHQVERRWKDKIRRWHHKKMPW